MSFVISGIFKLLWGTVKFAVGCIVTAFVMPFRLMLLDDAVWTAKRYYEE